MSSEPSSSAPTPSCRRRSPRPAARASPARRAPCTRSRALAVEAAPHADERVRVPLLRDRRRAGVAGVDDGLGRQLHQRAHDRVPQVRVGRVARCFDAAHRVLEQRVTGEHHGLAAGEPAWRRARRAGARRHRAGGGLVAGARRRGTRASRAVCPGVCSGRTSSAPKRSVSPASTVPSVRRARSCVRLPGRARAARARSG